MKIAKNHLFIFALCNALLTSTIFNEIYAASDSPRVLFVNKTGLPDDKILFFLHLDSKGESTQSTKKTKFQPSLGYYEDIVPASWFRQSDKGSAAMGIGVDFIRSAKTPIPLIEGATITVQPNAAYEISLSKSDKSGQLIRRQKVVVTKK